MNGGIFLAAFRSDPNDRRVLRCELARANAADMQIKQAKKADSPTTDPVSRSESQGENRASISRGEFRTEKLTIS